MCRYLPVVPVVLLNGAEGIGTGWSTFIPNYKPREIVANLRALLAGRAVTPMQPWCADTLVSCAGHLSCLPL